MDSFHLERIQRLMACFRLARLSIAPIVMLGVLFISACQPLTPTPTAQEAETDAAAGASATATAEPAGEALATEAATGGLAPAGLAIPALGLEIPVVPMAWEAVELDGQRTTQWVLPEDAAGWALNSAGAGEAGNVVIAGYQARGDAVFAALALGEVELGQDIVVTDEAGAEFIYRVVKVSEPLPVLGAADDERAQAAAYVSPTTDARLTLVTGWPSATTTHRIFVVAELAAAAP